MPRISLLKSIFALALVCALMGGAALPVAAQGDDTSLQEGTPPPDQGSEPLYGLLQLSAVSCTGGGEAGMVSILPAADYAPPGECIDGSSALLIDGGDYGPIAPYLELQLEAGVHSLYDPNSGAGLDVEVIADSASAVVIVTFAAAEPTVEPTVEAAAETATSGLLVVAHSCEPDVQSVDQLYALGDLTARLSACPAFTLSGYPSPGGTTNGGERSYDFTLVPETGERQSLTGNGSFVSDAFCESSVGALDNDPTNDRCVSNSGFAFELPEESITLTQTYVPDTMRYVAAETGSDADAGIITGSDPGAGYLGLDTSLRGTDQPVVHLFYLNPPRVNVVMHLCGPEVTSADDLQALGSLAAQLLTCPASAAGVGVTVTDNNWGARGLDAALFDPTVICESDVGDWDGDGGNNACVDAPTYRFDQTALGPVTVAQDYAPDGYTFGGANSNSGAIVAVDPAGIVSLDTSADGDVTIHLFDLVSAPVSTETPIPSSTPTKTPVPLTATKSPTRTATSPAATQTPTRPASTTTPLPTSSATATEPTGSTTDTGTVIVAALYCLSGSGTTMVALDPGEEASASDLGGASCFSGDATIQLALADGGSFPALKLGRDGVESIQNIPVTTAGAHALTEGLTGQSASFEVAPGTTTRVIIRYGAGTSMVDEGVASAGGTSGGTTGGTSSTDGLVTDELIGDEGVSSSAGSFDGISFTSLVVDDVDSQKVSGVKDAKSLPAVGVIPMKPVHQYLALAAVLSLLFTSVAFAARRTSRQSR